MDMTIAATKAETSPTNAPKNERPIIVCTVRGWIRCELRSRGNLIRWV